MCVFVMHNYVQNLYVFEPSLMYMRRYAALLRGLQTQLSAVALTDAGLASLSLAFFL